MYDYSQVKHQLETLQYDKAYQWIENKVRSYRSKIASRALISNAFGITFSAVIAFFTWVVLYPSGDKKELKAFPLAKLCNDWFYTLCEIVPGGKTAVIIGLAVLPFLISAVLAILALMFRPRKYIATAADNKRMAKEMRDRLEYLEKLRHRCDLGWGMTLFLYFFLTVALTGGVLTIGAVPAGLNPFEYLVVGAICGAIQAVPFLGAGWLFSLFYEEKESWHHALYDWYKVLDWLIDIHRPRKDSCGSSSDRMKNTIYYKEKFQENYNIYMGKAPEEKPIDSSFLDDHDYSDIFKDKNF